MMNQAGQIFVGRQPEMAVLTAALNGALAGQGRVVMLAGDPGIGKTRTSQELASLATSLGARVLWGWCYEREGAPPYWPWVQPVREYIKGVEPDQLRSQMGAGAADIAEVFPEVRQIIPDLGPPAPLEPEQARFRLFDSIATFLKAASEAQPLMLVLDDLHWADTPSLLLLEFIARELGESRLLVVGTYRDTEVTGNHPLSAVLAELYRNPNFQSTVLGGLESSDVGLFLQETNETSGAGASKELVDAIYAHTEGNPFFISEVIKLLGEQGELPANTNSGLPVTLGIPPGVLEVIGQRLNRLSQHCVQVLTTASIIGREFDFMLLSGLDGESTDDQLLEVIDEALDSRLVQAVPGAFERYEFSHALVQQTLAEKLSSSRKIRLHARIATALEAIYGENDSEHVAELAHHFGQAAPVVGPAKLAHYSLLSGEQALGIYAHEQALGHFERGLAAKGVDPQTWEATADPETAALLMGLGRSQMATLGREQIGTAISTLTLAQTCYIKSENVEGALAIAECFLPFGAWYLPSVIELFAPVLNLAPPGSSQEGRLLSRYGRAIGTSARDYEGATEAFEKALTIARQDADVALEMRTLANSAQVSWMHLKLEEGLGHALRVIEHAHQASEPSSEIEVRFCACAISGILGRPEEARGHAEAMLVLADRLRDSSWLSNAFRVNEMLFKITGDWKRARELSDRSLAAAPMDPLALAPRVDLECAVGNFDQVEIFLERLLDIVRETPPRPTGVHAVAAFSIPLVARITGETNRFEIARSSAQNVIGSPIASPWFASWARIGPALMAVQQMDAAYAQEQYAAMEPERGTLLGSWTISADRLLGLLAQTMDDPDLAGNHFEDSLTFCRQAGYLPELAWTCHDYAETLLQKNGPGDNRHAASLLDESLAISTDLGMLPLMERVAAVQERARAMPAKDPSYPSGLTQREVEVLRLVAAGRTDREIAEGLIISARTVSSHVGSILNKTGAANRAEAASYANQQGLISPISEDES